MSTLDFPPSIPAMPLEISCVIPVYCAEHVLDQLYRRLMPVLAVMKLSFEVIFIEDCGGDNSWEIIKGLAKEDSRVRGIRMRRNYGQHNALLCGIRSARGRLVITLDDDLQHPPEELPKLLSKLDEGYDVVYGYPVYAENGAMRDLASRITKLALQSVMGAETARRASSLRVLKTKLRDAFADYGSPYVSIDVLLAWATTSFAAIPVRHDPRKHGKSGYSLRKLVQHAANMMTGFSILPLQIASVAGFAFSLFGFSLLIFVISRWFIYGSVVPGFAFLASIVVIFSGVQLFALGIIGEYLARMHLKSMGMPVYSIDESIGVIYSEPVQQHGRNRTS